MIYGDLTGIRKSIINKLEDLYEYSFSGENKIDYFLSNEMAEITDLINKEVLIILNTKNKIEAISIGDFSSATFPSLEIKIPKMGLSGLRAIHTHPTGNSRLSEMDISALKNIRLDFIIAIGVKDRKVREYSIAYNYISNNQIQIKESGPLSLKSLNEIDIDEDIKLVNKHLRSLSKTSLLNETEERAILIGVNSIVESTQMDIETSMQELKELADTAGAIVIEILIQNKKNIDSHSYLGKGKVRELQFVIQNSDANLVIANDELSATQIRNMEFLLGVKVIDRTTLILDIFAKHAQSGEGKLQVELAQLKYRLPRLTGMGKVLSRTGGGIGTRGPGEKKLEIDRRHIYKQVNELEKKIDKLKKSQIIKSSKRQKNNIPIVSLVGYTNAGKSTLFNLLTKSDVISEDKLFATLDATTRKVTYNGVNNYLLSDTVGFIDKLPHDLVDAFKSTLREVQEADILLHLIDTSNPKFNEHIEVVDHVLKELKVEAKETILVFNKIDKKCNVFDSLYHTIKGKKICISAINDMGITELIELIENNLLKEHKVVLFEIPYNQAALMSFLYDNQEVIEKEYKDEVVRVVVNYKGSIESRLIKYLVKDDINNE